MFVRFFKKRSFKNPSYKKYKIGKKLGYNGQEISVEDYEILKGKPKHYAWIPASHGNIANRAVQTGTDNDEPIYVGRAPFEGSMTVGKIHPSHGCIYVRFILKINFKFVCNF